MSTISRALEDIYKRLDRLERSIKQLAACRPTQRVKQLEREIENLQSEIGGSRDTPPYPFSPPCLCYDEQVGSGPYWGKGTRRVTKHCPKHGDRVKTVLIDATQHEAEVLASALTYAYRTGRTKPERKRIVKKFIDKLGEY